MGELTPLNHTTSNPDNTTTHESVSETGDMTPIRQPMDYFAEQNQKLAEQRQKMKKMLKLIIPAVVVVVLMVLGVWGISIIKHTKDSTGPVVAEDIVDEDNSESIKSGLNSAVQLRNQMVEIYEPTYSIQDGDFVASGNMAEVDAAFEAAQKNPANKNRINTIYLSQILFYSDYGKHRELVEIADKVDPSRLNLVERVKFYNLVYLAYLALGDVEKADSYYALGVEDSRKLNIGSNGEEGK